MNIEQTYEYDASPETIFAYLTETDKLDTWWTTSSESDGREGGAFVYRFDTTDEGKAAGKPDHAEKGTYTVFEPAKALAYPWDSTAPTNVRFDFADNGSGGTTLKLTHSDIPDNEEFQQALAGGWGFFLGNLKAVLAGEPDQRAAFGLAV